MLRVPTILVAPMRIIHMYIIHMFIIVSITKFSRQTADRTMLQWTLERELKEKKMFPPEVVCLYFYLLQVYLYTPEYTYIIIHDIYIIHGYDL